MPRRIEIQGGEDAPDVIRLIAGDVLSIAATGGHVRAGADVVDMIGAFLPAVCTAAGEVVTPMGAPGVVLFVARTAGSASLEIVTGDPWSSSQQKTIAIVVGPQS
jgi:hypothetical protein